MLIDGDQGRIFLKGNCELRTLGIVLIRNEIPFIQLDMWRLSIRFFASASQSKTATVAVISGG